MFGWHLEKNCIIGRNKTGNGCFQIQFAQSFLTLQTDLRLTSQNLSQRQKYIRRKQLKVLLLGILEHARPNNLHLCSMTEEYETGTNHITESIRWFLSLRFSAAGRRPTLLVQIDTLQRENINRFFLLT